MSGPVTGSPVGIRQRVFGRSRWNVFLGILAVVILIGSFTVLAMNTMNEKGSDSFTLNGITYEWDTLDEGFDTVEVQGYLGVPLVDLVEDAGVQDPEEHEYKIIGADGYFKTVTWEDMGSGILTNDNGENKVVFENKAKAYWIRDVVEIEVI
ncbi:MAG: hypothetical protein JXA22_07785 [Candidatus Thermoplasmatota archaeon]|nr:hypothetical protein [Candidatus Thermoplasmatota archaeon]